MKWVNHLGSDELEAIMFNPINQLVPFSLHAADRVGMDLALN